MPSNGRVSRTNSSTSHQILARVIEAESTNDALNVHFGSLTATRPSYRHGCLRRKLPRQPLSGMSAFWSNGHVDSHAEIAIGSADKIACDRNCLTDVAGDRNTN